MHGAHSDCIKSFERFYFGPIGKGRKKRIGVIFTGEEINCECTCHSKQKGKKK